MVNLNELIKKYGSTKQVEIYKTIIDNLIKPIKLLEVGLDSNINCLKLWKEYFELNNIEHEIIGFDYNYNDNNYCIINGDQGNIEDLNKLNNKTFNIIIEDGSHYSADQQVSLKTLINLLDDNGYYIIENINEINKYDNVGIKTKELLNNWKSDNWINTEFINYNELFNLKEKILNINIYDNTIVIYKNVKPQYDPINNPIINPIFKPKDEIISYDMFDTLVFRYCNEPEYIFDIIQSKINNNKYKEHRRTAELNYHYNDIDDIYLKMKELFNYSDEELNNSKKIEIETEIENIYPNNELFFKLKETDIIVSDMYLHEENLRDILKKCNNFNNGNLNVDNIKIYKSNGGKYGGWIWKEVKEKFSYHIGDNHHSDYIMAQQCGIKAVHYKGTAYTEGEKYLLENGNLELANLCRFLRLINPYNLEEEKKLYELFVNNNVPLLLLTCNYLKNLNKKIIFENEIVKTVYEHYTENKGNETIIFNVMTNGEKYIDSEYKVYTLTSPYNLNDKMEIILETDKYLLINLFNSDNIIIKKIIDIITKYINGINLNYIKPLLTDEEFFLYSI